MDDFFREHITGMDCDSDRYLERKSIGAMGVCCALRDADSDKFTGKT